MLGNPGVGSSTSSPGFEQQRERAVQRVHPARGDDDVVDAGIDPVDPFQLGAQQLAQRQQPAVGAVSGVPVPCRVERAVDDVLRRDEARLAHLQSQSALGPGGRVEQHPDLGTAVVESLPCDVRHETTYLTLASRSGRCPGSKYRSDQSAPCHVVSFLVGTSFTRYRSQPYDAASCSGPVGPE